VVDVYETNAHFTISLPEVEVANVATQTVVLDTFQSSLFVSFVRIDLNGLCSTFVVLLLSSTSSGERLTIGLPVP
jgi:hypothetical protein